MAEVQSCPEVSLLQRLLDGLLTDEEQASLNEHLAECSACQERLDGLIAGQGMWSDVARNLKSAHAEIEAGTATRYAARPGEALDHADDDLTLEFLDHSDKPESLGRLGHYEVLEVIGRGGMGIVLRAFDEKLHRVVAIKVMAPRLAATSPPRKRFLREARAAAKVRHENEIDIHAVEEQPIPHLVMEFVPGESLQQRLDRIGPLEVPDLLRIGQQIARGLAAAHAQGLIHRDVKPGNVLLEKGIEERVKITDFGLARAADDASMTQSGVIAGTPLYMAPEQAQGGAIDHRADLFSFGTVLYTMASGRPPFRAPTSLAVLKRVVEDAPRPIQEIIPEVPQWLCDIIARLHAKRPEDRFQSAKEVADLLGQCQKEYAQPGQVKPLSKPVAPAPPPPKPHVAARATQPLASGLGIWVIAASLLLLFMCALSLSEATGVTHVAATVIRLFTSEGTLVVESNDPDVKVTIEGDGGLIITGAGLEEIRLRPGSYKVRANKAGKPISLDQELVTIARGDRQFVRVRVEGIPGGPASVVPSAEKGAFVLLNSKGAEVRKFDTLAEAVQGASDGDIIEIRGNGPFLTDPIDIGTKALVIQAGSGYAPVIKPSAAGVKSAAALLSTRGPLTLEGLMLQNQGPRESCPTRLLIATSAAPLSLANCNLAVSPGMDGHSIAIQANDPSRLQARNCLIVSWWSALFLNEPRMECTVDNCLIAGDVTLGPGDLTDSPVGTLLLTRNTTIGCPTVVEVIGPTDSLAARLRDSNAKPVLVTAEGNVCQTSQILYLNSTTPKSPEGLPVEEQRRFLPKMIRWQERGNIYGLGEGPFLGTWASQRANGLLKDLAEWNTFWELKDTGSVQQKVRLRGNPMLITGLEVITPDDFRLRPDSAGYKAGKDGKDLGADVDLVGPGAAYERWKRTPEYQEWRKETGQTRTEAPRPESQAFVVLTSKGVEVRKFDTLAEAVQGASAGDTIEIRGNGPFVMPPIAIHQSLAIRAGRGFWPVIRLQPGAPGDDCPITADAPLVLEGLEIREMSAKRSQPALVGRCLICCNAKSLHVANCRLEQEEPTRENADLVMGYSTIVLRNCQFRNAAAHYVAFGNDAPVRVVMDNCLGAGGGAVYLNYAHRSHAARLEFRRNTLVMQLGAEVGFQVAPDPALDSAEEKRIQYDAAGNLFDARLGMFEISALPAILNWQDAGDAEKTFAPLMGWRDQRNVYSPSATAIYWSSKLGVSLPLAAASLRDWERRWGQANSGSIEGPVRLQGGDLLAKAAAAPEKITPEDFRLRPDSPGHRAAKDGKDLGADVDLVGPGSAYERWKRTPEYQQWLTQTGQALTPSP
jgi:serine/threonine protein kinase